MIFKLASGTDVASHAIYDPAATSHLTEKEIAGALYEMLYEQEPLKGNVLLYDEASDGSTMFRIYVDEQIPEEFVKRSEAKVENLLLKVPSGTLVASGVEYLNNKKEIEAAAPFTPGGSSLVTKVKIPKGNYLVDAYEISFDWDKDIAPLIENETGSLWSREGRLGPMVGLGVVSTLIAIAVLVLGTIFSGWAWSNFWWLTIPITWLAISALLFKILIPKKYWKKKDEIAARFPPNILVFTRLPDDADITKYHGGGFGPAGRERFEARKKSSEPVKQ
jgi:hypothetical protein